MYQKMWSVFALFQRTRGRVSQICGFFILLSAALATVPAMAQTGQGSITGQVTDSKGAAIVGATVTVVNTSTGVQNVTKTDKAGYYNITNLNPASYRATMSDPGFKDLVTDNIILSAGATVPLNGTLSVGTQSQSVVVQADVQLLSTTTSAVSTTVDHTLVENMPYPEQSSLEAVLLVPGVNGDPLQPGGISTENAGYTLTTVAPGASISIAGNPPGSHGYYVDGSDALEASLPQVGYTMSGQNVGEMTVITSGMPANYGRSGSGAIVETSRAGASQYHGGVSWRHSDPFLNAYPLGAPSKNDTHQNFFGGYFGGPVQFPKFYHRNRNTFFWVGIEPARLATVVGVRGNFETPNDLAGHLYNTLNLLNQTDLKANGYAHALTCARVGDPNYSTTLPCKAPTPGYSPLYYQSPINGAGFPSGAAYGNSQLYQQIPNADVSAQLAQNPFAQFVFSLLPTPANPGPYVKFDSPDGAYATDGTNGSYQRGVKNIDNRYSFRIDQQFNNSNRAFFRYTAIPLSAYRFFAVSFNNPLDQTAMYFTHNYDFAMGFTHIFTNDLVTSFHESFMRAHPQSSPSPAALTQDYAAKYGLTPAVLGEGFPVLGGFNSYSIQNGTGGPGGRIDETFITGDDFVWTHGAHNIQFGVDLRWLQWNEYASGGAYGGTYGFSGSLTNNGSTGGSALAQFILGEIGSYTNTPVSVPGYYRTRYYAGYIQDDWRATSKLTINAGLRYNVETPRMEKFNNQAMIVPYQSTLNGLPTKVAFCFSGACGLGKTLWPTNYTEFEPRLGLAFASSRNTTIRAAYTLSHLPLTGWDPTTTTDPSFSGSSQTIGGTNGGINPGIVDYISNPIKGPLTSAYTALNGNRGPMLYSTGIAPVFVTATKAAPYMQTYGLSIQYQPASKTLLQVTYQGAYGIHLAGQFGTVQNTIPIQQVMSLIQQHFYPNNDVIPNPYGITNPGSTTPLTESSLQQLYPYPNFFNQTLPEIYAHTGVLHYNGFYASVNQRATKDLTFLANYSWSKGLDDVPDNNSGTSGGFGVASQQNPTDQIAEYSVSSFDQPSKLKAGYNYNLPFGIGQRFTTGHGIIDRLIGNFSTAGIVTSASGFPNHVTLGGGYAYFTSVIPAGTNGCTVSGSNKYCTYAILPAGYNLRPSFVPGQPLINKNWKHNPFNSTAAGGITSYLNTAAFTVPGSINNPALGNVPRTMSNARSPREFMFDAHLSKGFTVHENYRVNINANMMNAFNHPVYYGVSGNTLLNNVGVSAVTGTLVPSYESNFGELSQGNTGGMSRTVNFGASITF